MKPNNEEKTRLNKYIAECGICSRREADRLIEAGKVTVNGKPADMGIRVSAEDEVVVNGRKLGKKDEKVVLAYYKPLGITCTEKDKFADKTLKDVFDYPIRVTYAGRLDKESEGLLLMTNDGELINRLMKGSAEHEKEYYVRVRISSRSFSYSSLPLSVSTWKNGIWKEVAIWARSEWLEIMTGISQSSSPSACFKRSS